MFIVLFHGDVVLVFILAIVGLSIIAIYGSSSIYISFAISSRKNAINVEIPYFLTLVHALSSTAIPFYEILSIIEKSSALKAFAREISLAKKIATIKNISLLTALDILCLYHPSELMREYVRRIMIAASTTGDVRKAVESAFEAVFNMFESKINRLVERFTIVTGTALFAFLFIPIIIATLAPMMYASIYYLAVLTLSFQMFALFVLYAIASSYFPSSLEIILTPKALLLCALSLSIPLVASLYNTVTYLAPLLPRLDVYSMYAILLIPLVPGILAAEKAYRRAILYDKFMRVATDAASLATATGENYLNVLDRTAARYGKHMVRFTKRVYSSYTSEQLRKSLIYSAPSIFHASFLETLMYILLYGSSPNMLKTFCSTYERIINAAARVRSLALSIEFMFIGLSALIGGFLTYLDHIFREISQLVAGALVGGAGLFPGYSYSPEAYGLLESLTMLSLVLVSLFIGKVRGGKVVYGIRSGFAALMLYIIVKMVLKLFLV
uniref:Uncharacterized protein n=1 Tax=Ignisphaera aggregans TaxID=334771 RepID=A0A7C2ZLQ6_9CREN